MKKRFSFIVPMAVGMLRKPKGGLLWAGMLTILLFLSLPACSSASPATPVVPSGWDANYDWYTGKVFINPVDQNILRAVKNDKSELVFYVNYRLRAVVSTESVNVTTFEGGKGTGYQYTFSHKSGSAEQETQQLHFIYNDELNNVMILDFIRYPFDCSGVYDLSYILTPHDIDSNETKEQPSDEAGWWTGKTFFSSDNSDTLTFEPSTVIDSYDQENHALRLYINGTYFETLVSWTDDEGGETYCRMVDGAMDSEVSMYYEYPYRATVECVYLTIGEKTVEFFIKS